MDERQKVEVARKLVAVAEALVAQDDEDDVDEAFAQKVRGIRQQMTKLAPKKRRRLKQFGIGMIRPNATVEELVDALQAVLAA